MAEAAPAWAQSAVEQAPKWARGPAAPATPAQSLPASPQATALKETIVGPDSGKGQQQSFEDQEAIAKRLRASGVSDADIEKNPEWRAAAHDVNRSVMAAGTDTAMGAAGGELVGGKALGSVVPFAARGARAFAPPLGTVGAKSTASPIGDMLRKSITDHLGQMNEGQSAQFEAALKKIGVNPYSDPSASIAAKVFKNGDTVALLQRLSGGADWVENQAGAYAATKLHEITEGTGLLETHARRAARWAAQNADWLQEVPKVEEAVQKYISGLRRTAIAKGAGALAAGSTLPSWLKRGLDLVP